MSQTAIERARAVAAPIRVMGLLVNRRRSAAPWPFRALYSFEKVVTFSPGGGGFHPGGGCERHEIAFREACSVVRADFVVPVDDRPPDFLTVEEAGAVLRFSRGKAYELAREYLATGGASGMPVIRFGRLLRVPRALLEQWIGGPITWPIPTTHACDPSAIASPVASVTPMSLATRPPVRRSARVEQPSIPFGA